MQWEEGAGSVGVLLLVIGAVGTVRAAVLAAAMPGVEDLPTRMMMAGSAMGSGECGLVEAACN